MKELVVISGKGGTGKTSLVACFAALAERAVLADCDVDAADLHLVLRPEIRRRADFSGGSQARIDPDRCTACGKCVEVCRFGAVSLVCPDDPATPAVNLNSACRNCTYCLRSCSAKVNSEIMAMIRDSHGVGAPHLAIDPVSCEGCGVCAHLCPSEAIVFEPVVSGEWYVSETRCGPMVHARLGVGQESSGKLVTVVRTEARRIAQADGHDFVIVDGSPGIGCPVIASLAGADLALIVTEPTLSGLHDLERIADLTKHFAITTLVCINKCDINAELAGRIAHRVRERGMTLAGQVRYDPAVTTAQIAQRALVEYQDNGAAADIRKLWTTLREHRDAP